MQDLEYVKWILDQANKKDLDQLAFKPMLLFLNLHGHNFSERLKAIGFKFQKYPVKEEMVDQLASLYLDKEIMNAYLDDMSTRRKEFLNFVLWQDALPYLQIKEHFPEIEVYFLDDYRKTLKVKDPNHLLNEWKVCLDTLHFYYRYAANEEIVKHVYFKFPQFLRVLLALHMPKPEGFYLEEFGEHNFQQNHYEIVSFEKTIFTEVPIILSYHKQGKIQFSNKDYPTAATIKKMAKALHIAEVDLYETYYLRAGMLAGALSSFPNASIFELDSLGVIKHLTVEKVSHTLKLSVLFPFAKGVNRLNDEELMADKIELFLQLFNLEFFDKTWFSIDNLIKFFQYRFIDFNKLRNSYYEINVDTTYLDIVGPYQGSFKSKQFASDGFVKSCIYFFASWGILELAIDPAKYKLHSVFDNIVAFRLTDLGAYIFNKTNSYNSPTVIDNQLIFDTDGPFIKVEGNVDLARATLDNVADQITSNRFQFSPGKFLSDVNEIHDLMNKIELFKKTINEKLPPYWENYFNQLIENSRQIKPASGLMVFQIPADRKELIKLIATDVVLREIVVKAENFMVLIQKAKLKKFRSRMKELGYLI